jgi:hypothetical protein
MIFDNKLKLLFNTLTFSLRKNFMELQDAIETAKEKLLTLFAADNPKSIRLEEVEMDDFTHWIITLSYLRQADPTNDIKMGGIMAIAAALNTQTRIYKTVVINKDTGHVDSIKIHKNG